MKSLTESVTVLTKMVTNQQSNSEGDNRGRRSDSGEDGDKHKRGGGQDMMVAKSPDGPDRRPPWLLKQANMGSYCWTCGYNPTGKEHTSATCKHKALGHIDTATLTNQWGDSGHNKPA